MYDGSLSATPLTSEHGSDSGKTTNEGLTRELREMLAPPEERGRGRMRRVCGGKAVNHRTM